jgi:hypothetical protein
MSDDRRQLKALSRWTLRILFAVLAIFAPIAAWRFSCRLVAPEPYHLTPQVQLISRDAAEQMAIAEVKRREGWSGQIDPLSQEGNLFFVAVRRKPGPTKDWRYITIEGGSERIVKYEIRTDPLP